MKIAITGGLGFIGTELVSRFDGSDDEIIVVDFWDKLLRDYEQNRFPILDRVYRNLSFASQVITPDEFLTQMRESIVPDIIVHLGAIVDTTDLGSDSMIHENVRYTRALVNVSNGRPSENIPGLIFASSAATYGSDHLKPNNPYGLTKVLGEKSVTLSRGAHASLRFFNVFGAMEHHKRDTASLPFKLAQAYSAGTRWFEMYSPNASRDFIPVTSVARIIEELARDMDQHRVDPDSTTDRSGVYDVGTATATTLVDLDSFVMQAQKSNLSVVREVPMPAERVGRYQSFTCAGVSSTPVLGTDPLGTRNGIEEQYGSRT